MNPDANTPARFEGSYLGDAARLPADARLECKICWWVYDPAVGDEVWQIPPGTPFTALPAHWRCPECDGDAEQFMVIAEDAPR
ncbi:rubredoxin [Sphaerotilus sulfidivorans]|jgi:rubredoxin|uniref:Rubredoxin n=1 Tax=Sphaerotilus sulfidivorans TaxID=639200 RepID=A0ABV2IHN5_9BURK|nr:rubredoxin [Sphaerotilus sulfidivorans]MBP8175897.1 rubredoxin [Sphaerotilus sp.]MCK6403394.1 rubredoxin [Sphaerotilus sulfidivorans]NZD47915.1 rubredoxin [Sphaerotilus sulfidivorans]